MGLEAMSERPVAKQLLAALKPGDVVIAAKLDRMLRSPLDALDNLNKLKAQGLVDMGGAGTILSAVAESERDRIRGRVLETKADQRRRGRYLGGYRPFGYRIEKSEDDIRGGQLVPDEGEQGAIAEMRALRAEGRSLRAIAAALKERGFSISHEGVAEVLKREAIKDAARVGQESAPVLRAVSLRRLLEIADEIAAKHEARYRAA